MQYQTPELEIVQLVADKTIAADEGDNSVIVSADQLYPFPKN